MSELRLAGSARRCSGWGVASVYSRARGGICQLVKPHPLRILASIILVYIQLFSQAVQHAL